MLNAQNNVRYNIKYILYKKIYIITFYVRLTNMPHSSKWRNKKRKMVIISCFKYFIVKHCKKNVNVKNTHVVKSFMYV